MQVSKVLVVDGDRTVRDALVTGLRFVGLDAHGADDAAAARSWLDTTAADVMVLSDQFADGLADGMGAALAQAHDAHARTAIVVLASGASRHASPNYRSDATLLRPVSVGRVVEQVELLLRRRGSPDGDAPLEFGMLSLDVVNGRVQHAGGMARLGRTEARLLRFFMVFPEKVFSRSQLLERLWPASVRVEERTVDVHIRRLRLALEALGCAEYVQTVRGSGYRFSALPQ